LVSVVTAGSPPPISTISFGVLELKEGSDEVPENLA
jgi:hypothetical protein